MPAQTDLSAAMDDIARATIVGLAAEAMGDASGKSGVELQCECPFHPNMQ